MLLSKLYADPARFQKRDNAFSAQTVEGIVREGIVLAKFDPIPVVDEGDRAVVGGDGHSRFEAIRRIAELANQGGFNGIPREWWVGVVDFDIPVKLITESEARQLAWGANFSRDEYNVVEQARIFKEMLDGGLKLSDVVRITHRKPHYIRKTLALNVLCIDIKQMIGKSPDAGGVDTHVAQAMAQRFLKYRIHPVLQRELWVKVLAHAELTLKFVTSFIDRIGPEASKGSRQEEGFLFNIPPAVEHIVRTMKGRAENLRRAERGVAWLCQANRESDVLADWPQLKELIDADGARILQEIKKQTTADGEVLGAIVTAT